VNDGSGEDLPKRTDAAANRGRKCVKSEWFERDPSWHFTTDVFLLE